MIGSASTPGDGYGVVAINSELEFSNVLGALTHAAETLESASGVHSTSDFDCNSTVFGSLSPT
jgi:hypothetical protein